ncbi:hypothetical protein [Halococcus agarilyticus]|uniref:hypothetical protein n=1 Tax=Halococcus agarilyticus TaxID=1232219 RepID=UPI000678241A|nr:hypothetical protein [Halococcus agarilyticus]
MAPLTYIASTLVTGLIVVGLVAALARSREWRSAAATPGAVRTGGTSAVTTLTETARSPLGWTVAFLALVLVIGGGTIAFMTGAIPTAVGQALGVALVLVAATVMGGYLFWGVYHSARYRGIGSAQATGTGLWVLGMVLIVAIVVRLAMA